MNVRIQIAFSATIFLNCAFAGDAPPTEADIKAALERGKAVRTQAGLVPEALSANAFIVKVGGVRCGHGITTLEDAKAEGGAVYKLTEESRSAIADDEGGVIVDYKGVYLLNSGLGMISGNLVWKNTVKKLKENEQQVHEEKCTFKIENNELKWTSNVGGKQNSDSTPVNGETPVPQSIVTGLAALAEKSGNYGKSLCIPELTPLNEEQTFDIQPVWVTFEHAKDNAKATTISVVHLLGEFDKNGMALSPNNRWTAPQFFQLEGSALTKLPTPPMTGLSIEPVAIEKLDRDAALDLAKIAAAAPEYTPATKP